MPKEQIARTFRVAGRWMSRHRTTLRGSAAVGAAVVICWLSKLWTKPETWAALGQWAGAIGTILAVVVALSIAQGDAARARADEHRQQLEKQREMHERELAAARLVTGELVYHDEEDTPPEFNVGDFGDFDIVIVNHGSTPVLHPRVEGLSPQHNWDICAYDPTGGFLYRDAPTVLMAGKVDRVPISLEGEKPEVNQHPQVPVIGYTTVDGVRWRRTGADDPVRVLEGDSFPIGGPSWYRVRGSAS